ncbi:hypothetical protein D3C78_1822630 [compost metagenome]
MPSPVLFNVPAEVPSLMGPCSVLVSSELTLTIALPVSVMALANAWLAPKSSVVPVAMARGPEPRARS